jgi:hypothetical protein
MTPKEKAIELIDKYNNSIMSFLSDNMKYQNAIKCALISVDEILKNFGTLTEGQTFYTEYRAVKYYQEVKQELLNLKNK